MHMIDDFVNVQSIFDFTLTHFLFQNILGNTCIMNNIFCDKVFLIERGGREREREIIFTNMLI